MSTKIDWDRSRREQLVRDRGADPISSDNDNISSPRLVRTSEDELGVAIVKYAKVKRTLEEVLRMLELSGYCDRVRNLRVMKANHPLMFEALKRSSPVPLARCPHCKTLVVESRLNRHIRRAHPELQAVTEVRKQ
jgi:hypothetical protein